MLLSVFWHCWNLPQSSGSPLKFPGWVLMASLLFSSNSWLQCMSSALPGAPSLWSPLPSPAGCYHLGSPMISKFWTGKGLSYWSQFPQSLASCSCTLGINKCVLNIRKTEGDIIYKCGMLWKEFINNVFQPGPTSPTQLWPHLSSLSLIWNENTLLFLCWSKWKSCIFTWKHFE